MNVYDFDGTIYKGDCTLDFYLFSIRRKPLLLMLLPFQFMAFVKYYLRLSSKEQLKESFFVYLRYIDVAEYVSLFWKKNFYKIQKWYLSVWDPSDIIITASPEFLLEYVCGKLNVNCIGSIVDNKTGKLTGKNCKGAEKVERFIKQYAESSIDNFYSDDITDTPLAKIAKKAYFVKNNKITLWEH